MAINDRHRAGLRSAALAVGTSTAVATGGWLAVPPLLALPPDPRSWGGLPLAVLVGAGCAALLLGCVLWLAAGVAAVLLSRGLRRLRPRSRVAAGVAEALECCCPRAVRLLVTMAVGGCALTGAPPVVHAEPAPGGEGRHGHHAPRADGATGTPTDPAVLRGLALPDRVTGGPPRTVGHPAGATVGQGRPAHVTVRAGDSLWSLARELLIRAGGPTTDRRTTQAWHRVYRANRDRLGPDPDLVHPGVRLRVPPLDDLVTATQHGLQRKEAR